MKLHKKGDLGFVSVILGIFFILSMIPAAPFLYTMMFSKSDIEKCRASVSVKSISIEAGSVLTLGKKLVDPMQLNLDCHTRFLVAKKDGVFDGGRKAQDFGEKSDPRFDGEDLGFKLKTAVADRMWDCWYMFGAGETDPFSQLGGDTHCVPCYEIRFDDEVNKEIPTLGGFTEFLAKEYRSAKQDMTYAKYLYKSDDDAALPQTGIDTAGQYGIVYYRKIGRFYDEAGKAAFGGSIAGGCMVGVYAGAAVGSAAPLVGTVVGGAVGGAAGCLGGFAVGLMTSDALTNDVNIGVAAINTKNMPGACRKIY